MDIVPAIDLRGGRCVRLLKGAFDAVTRYDDDPVELAMQYAAAGARLMHLVDLDGAETGSEGNDDLIGQIIKSAGLPVQVGGGIRDAARITKLLNQGAHRVVIGSIAVEQPAVVAAAIETFGPERIVIALDVRKEPDGTPQVRTHGWTKASGFSLDDVLDSYTSSGLMHVLCTDIDRDGAMTGPSTTLYRDVVRRYPALRWQASGGVRNLSDLITLRDCGLSAAITGKALLENNITLKELEQFSANA